MYTVIKVRKEYETYLERLTKYYGVLNVLNSFFLKEGEVLVLAYIAAGGQGRIESMPKSSFYKCREALVDRGFLMKDFTIHPQLHIEFESLILNIQIDGKDS